MVGAPRGRWRHVGFGIRSEERINAAEEPLPHSPLKNSNSLQPSVIIVFFQPFLEIFPFAFEKPKAQSCFHSGMVYSTSFSAAPE